MNNAWNRIIYRLWAPIYDATVNHAFAPGRRRALELLNLRPGERVLIPGVGTGADLPFLPAGVLATGIDLSPAMLAKARRKVGRCAATVELIQGDAQSLPAAAGHFDAAILNLILSVVPDAHTCLASTLRALKPGGRIVIFDKFLHEGERASPLRRFVNLFSTVFGTDINRRLADMMRDCPCGVVCDEPSIAHGMYRVILLKSTNPPGEQGDSTAPDEPD